MLDRQEIDALLVSALYGELTPADEARLTTHLESHPTDRAALDDLKTARQAVRESRIFELQLDPPQALSALLLQEAARRAPRKVEERGESWFARFVRSFVAHPAMAAAATLVLVVGVAGTLYLRNNDQVAQPKVAARDEVARTDQAPAVAGPAAPAAGSAAMVAAHDDGVAVKLADSDTKNAAKEGAKPTSSVEPPKPQKPASTTPSRDRIAAAEHGKAKLEKIEVNRRDPQPKDLEAKGEANLETEGGFAAPPGATGRGAATGASAPRQQVPAAPPPPPSTAIATVEQPAPAPAAKPDVSKTSVTEDTSWARDTHQRLTTLVRAGKCQNAAPLAVQIKNRAPEYYNAFVANDRALKQCMAYINSAAERDAEKSEKSRPAKRSEALDAK